MIQRIYIPLKTSSCGMFSRIYPKKHEARSTVIDLSLATEGTQVIDLSLGSSKNVFETSFEENMEHEVRLRACSLGSFKNVFENSFEKT